MNEEFLASLVPVALVTTTVATSDQAQQLAHAAVHMHMHMHMAACAQVQPIASHYIWEGDPTHSEEWRIVFKTAPDAVSALWQWLGSHHPYDVPQLLLHIEQAAPPYAAWVKEQVKLKK